MFNNLRLSAKLFASFAVLIVLLIGIGSLGYFSSVKIINLSHMVDDVNHLHVSMLQMRQAEKDFILRESTSEDFLKTGQSKYRTQQEMLFSKIDTTLKQLAMTDEIKSLGLVSVVSNIDKHLNEYENDFERIVEKLKLVGFTDSGLRGDLRNAANSIEISGIPYNKVTLLTLRRYEKDFFMRNDMSYVKKANKKIVQFKDEVSESKISDKNKTTLNRLMNEYQQEFNQVATLMQEIGLTADQGLWKGLRANFKVIDPQLVSIVKQIASHEDRVAEQVEVLLILITLLAIIIGLIMAWLLTRMISRPIVKLTTASQSLSQGDLDLDIDVSSNDEIGALGKSLNLNVESAKELASAAEAIGKGNYTVAINPRSDKDTLGLSLLSMRDNLKELNHELEERNWVKTEVAEIANMVQDLSNTKELAQAVTARISDKISAGHAAFYVNENSENSDGHNETLTLLGSFAYKERKNISNKFKLGEGIIGQVALEKKAILLTDVPADYIQITSGLGEQSPLNIMALPIIYEGKLLAVLELASFTLFTEAQQSYLEQVVSTLGVSLSNIASRQKTEELLEESQTLTEELQSQQEELRASNEELEEKTKILQESEEELKTQSEELQASNEELEEKSEHLSTQKAEIEKKNSDIQQASQELEEKAAALEVASKYKSEFLANMSHELRTPLNSLLILSKGFADNDEGNLSEDQIEEAKVIYGGGQDLLNLINDILDLSKVEAGKLDVEMAMVDITEIETHLHRQFDHVAKSKELEFMVDIKPGTPTSINTDVHRLEQIIKNLLSNAFKFTSQGSVKVEFHLPESGVKLLNDDLDIEKVVAITVVDTGIGIPLEKQKAIFEAFQQADGSTSRNYGGTGLGLTISREMAKLLKGEVQVKSTEGAGSSFTLYLNIGGATSTEPSKQTVTDLNEVVSDAVEANKPTVVETIVETPKQEYAEELQQEREDIKIKFVDDDRDCLNEHSKVLLIVEDDLNFAKTLMTLAKKKAYSVIIAGTGKAALQLTATYQPVGILLDMGLPDLDGAQVLERLKFNLDSRHIPVHIISGRDVEPELLQKGAMGFLTKPVSSGDLDSVFSKITGMLDGENKTVLVVEDDPVGRTAIVKLIKHDNIKVVTAENGLNAEACLEKEKVDCIILDLNLPDISGTELLKKLSDEGVVLPPVIIYTGKELTKEEHEELSMYSQSIVIKGVSSPERLLDEVSLFLHSVEAHLEDHQKQIIQMLHDPEQLLKGRKLLLVDDDMRNIFAMSKVLEKQGVNVVMASNGQIALDKLAEDSTIELVVMDIMMPIMDGFEAIEKIRAQQKFKDLPIIALTAKAMTGDREKCLEAGANDYMTKPVEVDKLLSMLKVWLFK